MTTAKLESAMRPIWTNGQSNLTKGRIAAAYGRFNRIRYVALMCTPIWHCFLEPPKSAYQTASRLVNLFLHSSRQKVAILYNRQPLPLKLAISRGGSRPHLACMVPWAHASPQPKGHLYPFSSFCRFTIETDRSTDRPTDRPRYSVCNSRPHLRT